VQNTRKIFEKKHVPGNLEESSTDKKKEEGKIFLHKLEKTPKKKKISFRNGKMTPSSRKKIQRSTLLCSLGRGDLEGGVWNGIVLQLGLSASLLARRFTTGAS
jgi:hypothetical protein